MYEEILLPFVEGQNLLQKPDEYLQVRKQVPDKKVAGQKKIF
jgi:hypothetical protein